MSAADSAVISVQRRSGFSAIRIGIFLMFVLLGIGLLLPHFKGVMIRDSHSPQQSSCRQLGQILFAYATDNGGRYPVGNSSTEVFQKLIESNYVSDPDVFYFPFPGKTKPIPNRKLKPENVCFDLTNGVTADDSDDLPLVISTGWKIDYIAGGSAFPFSQPAPQPFSYYVQPRTWNEWWHGEPTQKTPTDHLSVCFKGNFTQTRTLEYHDSWGYRYSSGKILNVIPKTFNPKGKTYHQLTPNGPLP